MFRSLYRRLGQRYTKVVVFGGLPFAYLTGLLAVAGTALYVDMSAGEFVRLLLVAWLLLWTPDVLLAARVIADRLGPVRSWLGGSRGDQETVEAWQAAAGIPLALARSRLLYAVAFTGIAIWDAYAIWELDLAAYSFVIVFPAGALIYLYWVTTRFLAVEQSLQPVLEDVAGRLPDRVELEPLRVPLRWRLLASLPALNIITGIAVAGFSAEETDDASGIALALLGSAAAGILVSSWLVAFLSASIVTPISRLRDANRRIAQGDLSVRVPVASTDESGELARSFNEMATGLEERERLREAFGAFVDPELAERVQREGTDLAGEEVEVSVLFMDIRDFTSYAEVVPVLTKHGGHANKFIGDGLLAVFGAPERLPDHADRAVAAALEVAKVVQERFGDELRVGVGVNSGPVMSGTIGGGGRLDFTVIGDAVNTAARVEAATRDTGDEVLITEATRSLLSDSSAEWEDRPTLPLKGKSEEVRLFAAA